MKEPKEKELDFLVSGTSGFVGQTFRDFLLQKKIRLIELNRVPGRSPFLSLKCDGLELGQSDSMQGLVPMLRAFREKESSRQLVAVNLSSYGVLQGQRDSDEMIRGNPNWACQFVEFASQLNASRLIQIGSCSEYAPSQHQALLTENSLCQPTTFYGAAKLSASMMALTLASGKNLPCVVFRLFGVYGPREHHARLVPFVLNHLALKTPSLPLTGGEQIRDFTYVVDVAEAIFAGAQRFASLTDADCLFTPRVFNICSGIPRSIRSVSEAVVDALGASREILDFGAIPYRSDECMFIAGDPKRFIEWAEWTPRFSLNQGIMETHRYLTES